MHLSPQVQKHQERPLPKAMSNQHQQPQAQLHLQKEKVLSPNGSEVFKNSALLSGSTPIQILSVGQSPQIAIDPQRAEQYSKQRRYLIFLKHASVCTKSEGQCKLSRNCHQAQQLWNHLRSCHERNCQYARCNVSKNLLGHYQICKDSRCPVCRPVTQIVTQKQPPSAQSFPGQCSPGTVSSFQFRGENMRNLLPAGALPALASTASISLNADVEPPSKRVKVGPESFSGSTVTQPLQQQTSFETQSSSQVAEQQQPAEQPPNLHLTVKSEGAAAALLSVPETESQINQTAPTLKQRQRQVKTKVTTQVKVESHTASEALGKPEPATGGVGSPGLARQETANSITTTTIANASIAKSSKGNPAGTSLAELITPELTRDHIRGLPGRVGLRETEAEKGQVMEQKIGDNTCSLCALGKLTFEPPLIYCTPCADRIKRNAVYYTAGLRETKHYFCNRCYKGIRKETIKMDGLSYLKSTLKKRKNNEEAEEPWVQCGKCNIWNHQICGLFNGLRNGHGEETYTCPGCCMLEAESSGDRNPLQSSLLLGAKDLPKTFLSDHLEQRLALELKHERKERARALGKSIDEVPGAESLVIRVVSSVNKKLHVKQWFKEIFQEQDHPKEFSYKSKVLLLFQEIEGVEVCLFGMYVQEFGSECQHPNQRRVYLSYMDSVKYFRPDVKTLKMEALRTFAYHEILIAYLDYCKRRGFSSCYIWACPPLKGEDYILYCHPEIQKTPKSNRLRDWYLKMLEKATSDGIVVEVTNLYDYFFVSTGECKAKVTAARLPYFDGDYFPDAVENVIQQLNQGEGCEFFTERANKNDTKTRASKSAAQAELARNTSKDLQLMHKLGDSIFRMKEDFILVHMHFTCTHCRLFILSGYRWSCNQCKNFNLCQSCYEAERKRKQRDRHPIRTKEAHVLTPIQVEEIPQETKDKDDLIENEFFDTRQTFISLCQINHYQYDTLRRAKYSSKMVLYHLHNPTASALVVKCNMCFCGIELRARWRCETCSEFNLCQACKSLSKHPHKLKPHSAESELNAQNKQAKQQFFLQVPKMLDLIIHSSQCNFPQCNYAHCRGVKGLFRHGIACNVRASGGCVLCKRMWYFLQLHARDCNELVCRVPRCKDLKEHVMRSNRQQESRRRAVVMEMMRQRAAEIAEGSN